MSNIQVVFVEFGRFPRYTALNIKRLNNLFPEIPIVVLTDVPEKTRDIREICKIVEWSTDAYKSLNKLKNYQNSGDKFWLHTTSRLLAFCDYHIESHNGALLHVESDVILTSHFPFTAFLESKNLLWGRYNNERDVAALIYSPSKQLTKLLKSKIESEFEQNSDHTDMSLLSSVAKKLGDHHSYLPSFPSPKSQLVNRRSSITTGEINSDFALFEKFGGIFDHAVIGMWLDGIDPKHRYGIRQNLFTSPIIGGESYIDPMNINYRIENPFAITIKDEAKEVPLYSLHIHSKSERWFKLEDFDTLRKRMNFANHRITFRRLDIRVLIQLIYSNIRGHTLGSWISNGLRNIIRTSH